MLFGALRPSTLSRDGTIFRNDARNRLDALRGTKTIVVVPAKGGEQLTRNRLDALRGTKTYINGLTISHIVSVELGIDWMLFGALRLTRWMTGRAKYAVIARNRLDALRGTKTSTWAQPGQ